MKTKIPKFCKNCGLRLVYRSDNGSENNGWNRLEHSSFNEFTGKRIGPKYSYQVILYCPTWNELGHMRHTCEYYSSPKMFDLKKYGVTPTVYKKEDDIIHGLPREEYMKTYCQPSKRKKFLGII